MRRNILTRSRIVEQKSRHFEPAKLEDHYENALTELLNKKQKGLPIVLRRRRRLTTWSI